MAALISRYTDAPYVQPEGKVLLANKVYVGTADAIPYTPTAPIGDAYPSPSTNWNDVGSLFESKVTINIPDPQIIDVTTGLFEKLRGQVGKKAGVVTFDFHVVEFEPDTWASFSTRVAATVGSQGLQRYRRIGLGGEVLISRSVLIVGQNAASGNEFQFWINKGRIRYSAVDQGGFSAIKVTVTALEYTPLWNSAISVAFEMFYFTQ